MDTSYLIQRLEKPSGGFGKWGKDNPFSFGGGIKNGGLSDEAMDLLRDIFAFDYMGAAEYEFGIVAEMLNKIANAKELEAFEIVVPLAEVPRHWKDKSKTRVKGDATIYVLCPAELSTEVTERVIELAHGKSTDGARTRDHVGLKEALRPHEDWDTRNCGWLELSNGFFFFTDVEMWRKTCLLFGVE